MGFRAIFGNRSFFLFWLAQLISQFGDRITQMALVGLVAGRGFGSATELGNLLAFTIIPVFVVGPIAGAFVDRWDRKLTLFVCDILRGLLILLIPLVLMDRHAMGLIYTVVFLAFCLSRFYVPAKMSIIPEIVPEEGLHTANSLATVTGMIAFVLGALLGGLVVEYGGARGGFLCDVGTFFVSAALIAFIARPRLEVRPGDIAATGREMAGIYRTVWHDVCEGVRYILAHADIRAIIGLMMVLFMAAGAVYVVMIVFVQQAFGSVTKHLGFLAVGLGTGLFLGSVAYGKWGNHQRPVETIFKSLMAGGLVMTIFSVGVYVWRNIWAAQALAMLLGMVTGPVVIAANTVVHRVAASAMQGKVFSSMEFVIHAAFLLTMLLTSRLAEWVPAVWILVAVGGIFFLTGVWGMMRYRRGATLA